MLFSAKITLLQNQVADLTGQLTAATGNVTALTGEKADLERQLTEANTRLEGSVTAAAHQAALDEKLGEITRLQAQIKAAEDGVDKKVVEGIAKTGFAAVHRDPKAVENPVKTDTKRAGTPRERLAAGIKIDMGSGK